ncbi:MAG: response regulator transcription factor [Bacteroidia bacterium]|nr:response regulator transcription factor [Bacteroidia bacterium]
MNNNDTKIKIAIVDDEALIVMLLNDYFSKHPRVVVSFTANDGSQLIENLRKADSLPDIVLLDLQMKELNGIETATILKKEFSDLKIIVISSYYKKSFLGHMLKLGINAFLPKGIHPNQLVEAIEEVFTKGYYFMEEQIEVMRNQISSNTPAPCFSTEEELSERETEILKLICQQFTAQQIADKLFISTRTVEGHKSNLLLKTSTRNLAGLVIYAVQKNLINIDDCLLTH